MVRESYFDYEENEYSKGEGSYKYLYRTREEAEIKLKQLELDFFKGENLQKLFKIGSSTSEEFGRFIKEKVETAKVEIKEIADYKLNNKSIIWTELGKCSLDLKAMSDDLEF